MADKRRLLHARRRKLIVGASILAVASILVLIPEYVSTLLHLGSFSIGMTGGLLFALTTIWLARAMKCRACGVNLFLYGLNHTKYGNWLDWSLRQVACPKCGYEAPDDSSSSKHPP